MGGKALRYTAVSVISIVVSLVTLYVTFDMLRVASAGWCQVIATAVGTVPSYTLNRYWAWGKRGRSRLLQEVVPFWVVAFIGLAFSVYAVDLAATFGHHLKFSHTGVTLLAEAASLTSYGVLWVGKFVIFNRFLFADRDGPGGESDGHLSHSGDAGDRSSAGGAGDSSTGSTVGMIGPPDGPVAGLTGQSA